MAQKLRTPSSCERFIILNSVSPNIKLCFWFGGDRSTPSVVILCCTTLYEWSQILKMTLDPRVISNTPEIYATYFLLRVCCTNIKLIQSSSPLAVTLSLLSLHSTNQNRIISTESKVEGTVVQACCILLTHTKGRREFVSSIISCFVPSRRQN